MKDFLSEQLTRNGYVCELITVQNYRIYNYAKNFKGDLLTYEEALKLLTKAKADREKAQKLQEKKWRKRR